MIQKPLLQLCMIMGVVFIGMVSVQADKALLIGVRDYQSDSVTDLNGVEKDVENMQKLLQQLGLKPSDITILQDSQVTDKNVVDGMIWLMDNPGEKAYFYFSGHGSQIPDTNGDETDDKKDETLCLYNWYEVKDNMLYGAITDDIISIMLNKIQAKETYIIIDSCHSGTMYKSLESDGIQTRYIPPVNADISTNQLSQLLQQRGLNTSQSKDIPQQRSGKMYAVLSACQDDESAVGNPEGGFFTRGLLHGIQKAIREGADTKSLIDLVETSEQYIRQNLSNPTMHHTPNLSGHNHLIQRGMVLTNRSESSAWQKLENVVAQAADNITLEANQVQFRLGEELNIRLTSPRPGYLYILNMTDKDSDYTMLFPNQYDSNNRVPSGMVVTLPPVSNEFRLPANRPTGKSMIVAVITPKPILNQKGEQFEFDSLFKSVTVDEVSKSFGVEETKQSGYSAGKIIVEIVE